MKPQFDMQEWVKGVIQQTNEFYRRMYLYKNAPVVRAEDDTDGPSYLVADIREHEETGRPLDEIVKDEAERLSWPL